MHVNVSVYIYVYIRIKAKNKCLYTPGASGFLQCAGLDSAELAREASADIDITAPWEGD